MLTGTTVKVTYALAVQIQLQNTLHRHSDSQVVPNYQQNMWHSMRWIKRQYESQC